MSYRAGGTIHTVESSNWIDAWFPFDYSSRAPVAVPELIGQKVVQVEALQTLCS